MALAAASPAVLGCAAVGEGGAPPRAPAAYHDATPTTALSEPSNEASSMATPAAAPAPQEAPPEPERREEVADAAGLAPAKSAPASGAAAPPPPPPPPPGTPATTPGPRGREASAQATDSPHQAAMLIYTAHVTMAVYQTEPGLAAVERLARDLGGYLANRSDTEITIRIPRAAFDEAIRRVALSGDVVHKEVTAQDVTDEYLDLEIRLKNARNMRDRLAELLKRAAVKEALEIEKELGRVTQEVERIEGRLKLLSDKIAFSTITVTFAARGPGALRDMPLRLPFPWLSELGLPRLLSLHEGGAQ